jgi:O-acetyl-ADP-ribose deacetylase (regulator of RNase III)
MIRYTQGNLLGAPVDALVNTVNEVGVMGKGIALQFRDAFPESAREYEEAAKAGRVRVGHVFVTTNRSLLKPHWIIHFPTKKHWRQPSQLAWVREGLKDLVRVVRLEKIGSIALPPLGCGNGGLQWSMVRREIEAALSDLPGVDITVFEPTSEYHNAPKRAGVEDLTPARALIAELVRRYSIVGIECSVLEVQKLAWFLLRVIGRRGLPDAMGLKFAANKYGPYADQLRFLLDSLDGSYLHCEKRLADAKPLDSVWFEDSKQQVVAEYLSSGAGSAYARALDEASSVIDGFESPFGMELLATVDWLVHVEGVEPTVPGLRAGLAHWPAGTSASRRKNNLFDDRALTLALDRLTRTVLS